MATDQRGVSRLASGCTLGAVELLPQGAPCSAAWACLSGSCADGVCCDTACGGSDPSDCLACSAAAGAAQDGTCTPRPAGQRCRESVDPYDPAEVCDGQGPACPADVSAVPVPRGAGGGFAPGCAVVSPGPARPAGPAPSLALLCALGGAALSALALRRRRKEGPAGVR